MPDALLAEQSTLGDIIDHLARHNYWDYPRPPTTSAADLARADYALLAVRPPLHALFRGVLRTVWRFRVEGRERIPKRGPFVLVANHSSHGDTPCALAALPLRRVNDTHPLAAQDYFFSGGAATGRAVHALFNALPIDRTESSEKQSHSPASRPPVSGSATAFLSVYFPAAPAAFFVTHAS